MGKWYDFVAPHSDLQQGDILFECPVFFPDPKVDYSKLEDPAKLKFEMEFKDVIVMSQSCDIQQGAPSMGVMLCPVTSLITVPKVDNLRNLCSDKIGSLHLLNKQDSTDEDPYVDYYIVDFKSVYTIPLATLKNWKGYKSGKIPRLTSPYAEAMSQRFGFKLMRIGTDDTAKPNIEQLKSRWEELRQS
ncbi:hypothetical protein ABGV43_30085 [Paenibacillus amylolyticus]|uniref:hypothetical protein n=1 Tax=Paenibacillus amylolyticus TaxID=1451 RepID=UPI003241DFF3